jgi:hypothetical protein
MFKQARVGLEHAWSLFYDDGTGYINAGGALPRSAPDAWVISKDQQHDTDMGGSLLTRVQFILAMDSGDGTNPRKLEVDFYAASSGTSYLFIDDVLLQGLGLA